MFRKARHQRTSASGASLTNTWAQYNGTSNGSNNNQISATGQNPNQGNGYDKAGNIANDGLNTYLYDAEGRICAVNNGSTMTGYIYNAEGARVTKGSITTMSCDPTANGFEPITDYVLGPG